MQTDAAAAPIVIERLPAAHRALRLAVVTETYPPEVNGVALTVACFIEGLRRRGHQIQLVRPRQGSGEGAGTDAGFEQVLTRGVPIPRYPHLRLGLPAQRALAQRWSFQRPDLVHIVTEGPLGWSALQAASKLKLPVCSDFRTNFHAYSRHYGVGWLGKPILAYLRKFHNRTLRTLVPTPAMRCELAGMGFRNLAVVARGVDARRFHPGRRSPALRAQWRIGPDEPAVLHVGRVAPEKNLPDLVAAFDAMRARVPGARLVVVGDGPALPALRSRYPHAVFAGMRLGDDLAAHYASGDIFLVPSLTETYGNVTVEAMASGLAVVAYDYAAAAQHIRSGENGVLAPFADSAAFVGAAAGMVADARGARALGARARETAEALDWSRVVLDLEAQLLAAAGRGSALSAAAPGQACGVAC